MRRPRRRMSVVTDTRPSRFILPCGDSQIGAETPLLGVARGVPAEKTLASVDGDEQQSGGANSVLPLIPVALCFVVAGVFIYFGMPESSLQGFLMAVVGVLAFCFGVYLTLNLCFPV